MLTTIGDYETVWLETTSGRVRYTGTHRVLPRRAVIEMLEIGAPPNAAVRLLRQACILEALQHSSVPRVFECGRIDGRPWIAYEAREGARLDREMAARALGVGEVMDVMEHVANVLCHAHSRGVLHRDITPHAILLETGRGVVLDDWQNASIADSELCTPLKGTSPYRAPELIHDLPADGRADIYALGMIAIRALAGPDALIVSPANVHPPVLATLLANMVNDDPFMRPTAAELVAAIRDIRGEIASAERENDELEVDLEVAAVSEIADDDLEITVSDPDESIVLLDQPRLKPRWTPQWGIENQAAAAYDIVQIEPRGRRSE
jgi:serine/threonine protein kinase